MLTLAEFKTLLQSPLKVVITTHPKPDADALGSSLALFNYLKKYGHQVQIISPTDYPRFLDWMPGQHCVINFDESAETKIVSKKYIEDADLIFCLDFNRLDRITEVGELIAPAKGKKVLIDHHLSPDHFADFEYWDAKAAATCELIFDLICDLGDKDKIDVAIGDCIYAGIMTDTGSFRFPCTSKKVHLIIAELISIGVDNSKIHRLIYDNNSEERLKFLGYALKERLIVMREFNTAFFHISHTELDQYHSQTGDTEGLVNYALSIEGIVLAAMIIERPDAVKISFRSAGEFSVNDFARNHFEGGGHKNAAGGKSDLNLEQTVIKFKNLLPEYAIQLQNKTLTIEYSPC